MRRNIILIFISILVVISLCLLIANLNLKKSLQDLTKEKEVEFKERLDAEKGKLEIDLEEKHRADKVSYKAMIKRLELQKKTVKEMKKEIEELKK